MKRKKYEFEQALEADVKAIKKATREAWTDLGIPGWSQSDADRSVNNFMSDQNRLKPRKPLSRGLSMRMVIRAHGKCEDCGTDLFNVKFAIHHKNYDPTDNRESNLMVVCRPCHKKMTGPRPISGSS